MKARYNLWLEKDGQVALSLWRVRLLAAIGETGSISQAARQLNVPYRIAWQKVSEMEERLGEKLVETQVGGVKGGGARLTKTAQQLIEKFLMLSDETRQVFEARYRELFED